MEGPAGGKENEQYDRLSAEYAALVEIDPAKIYVQYPGALKLLGDAAGKSVLDVGCGNGTFTRMLARRGARVAGYDPSVEQIREARKREEIDNLGISYFVGLKPPLSPAHLFDDAVSVMVLPYASDRASLQRTFVVVMRSLKRGGSFCSVTYNPGYQRLGKAAYNRRFSKTAEGGIQVDFLDNRSNLVISARFSDYSRSDYEDAAQKAGFSAPLWVRLAVTGEGIDRQGDKFWHGFEDDPPYIGFKVVKQQ